jgi:hypothetical protein
MKRLIAFVSVAALALTACVGAEDASADAASTEFGADLGAAVHTADTSLDEGAQTAVETTVSFDTEHPCVFDGDLRLETEAGDVTVTIDEKDGIDVEAIVIDSATGVEVADTGTDVTVDFDLEGDTDLTLDLAVDADGELALTATGDVTGTNVLALSAMAAVEFDVDDSGDIVILDTPTFNGFTADAEVLADGAVRLKVRDGKKKVGDITLSIGADGALTATFDTAIVATVTADTELSGTNGTSADAEVDVDADLDIDTDVTDADAEADLEADVDADVDDGVDLDADGDVTVGN